METPKDAIAIIGMGCRYPGAPDIDSLWRLLKSRESAVREIPADRIGSMDYLYNPRPATPGRIMSRYGGFLEKIELFDADFFGIAPLEARQLDPQQRILLEVVWEALEDAGIPAGHLSGSSAGVFIGCWLQDFETRLIGDPLADDMRKIDLYTTTGSGRYPLAGRISYFLGLQGPSLVVDTACSSSLVAIHLACRSLLQKECEIAFSGGVNILLTPYITVAYSQSQMMAPDGRCKFGDALADGYVRSEGCGVVVLKLLSKAIQDGDTIHAVIHGSAVNNDGRTSGYLTTPGVDGQKDLLRKAYQDAGIAPHRVQYVEAHGTGTLAGDPVELEALGAVLSEGRGPNAPCLVGSIKTNLGHTEGAAGVAGLIKVALAIKHREIPASLNHDKPNPKIPWETIGLKIPTHTMPWPSGDGSPVAGVSAFGIAGTNAHIVLGERPAPQAATVKHRVAPGRINGQWILPLSAHSIDAQREMARRLHARVASENPAPSLDDLCATAALKREHLDYRMLVVARNIDQIQEGLAAYADGEDKPGVHSGSERIRPKGKLAFVYPGQGSQWLGMCRELMQHSEVFREALHSCQEALKPYVDWLLIDQLVASEADSRLDDISVIQPLLFSIQVALTEQWKAWGVIPDAVIGHSMGEPAAAYVAGVLNLDAAAKIITARSRLMNRTSGQGAMAVVELTLEQAQAEIAGREELLSIAVSNSPRSTVFSGDPTALDEMLAELEQRKVFCRKINVDVASHSPQMEPLRGELVATLSGLAPQSSAMPIYSTVTGALLEGTAFDASYWGNNLRRPVRFSETVARMLEDGHTIFIEMSPHPVLLRAIDECAQAGNSEAARLCTTLPSLLRKESEPATILESLGRLYILGHPFDWRGLYGEPEQRFEFPPYAWQRERHWFEEEAGRARSQRHSGRRLSGRPRLALLDRYITSSIHTDLHLWESELDTERLPWLSDHTVQGHVIFPGAGYIEAAASAAEEALGGEVELRDLEIREALFVDRKVSKTLQVAISGDSVHGWEIRILSRLAGVTGAGRSWREHIRGKVVRNSSPSVAAVQDVEAIRTRCKQLIPGDLHYSAMQRLQIGYGPSFRSIERIGQGESEAVARIRAPQAIAADNQDYRIHPALVDSGLQLLVSMAPGVAEADTQGGAWMPVGLDSVYISASLPPTDEFWAVAQTSVATHGEFFRGDFFLLDLTGRTFMEARGVVLKKIGYTLSENIDQWLYEVEWHSRPLSVQNDGAAFLPDPAEIEREVVKAPLPKQLEMDVKTAEELLPKIEKLSINYIVEALAQLGLPFESDRTFTTHELADQLRIGERHHRLLDRLLGFLREEGVLIASGGGWCVAQPAVIEDSRTIEDGLLSRFPQCRTELNLLSRCGRHLAEVLTGTVAPLELLFPGGSMNEAEILYRDSVFSRIANHQSALALQAAIEGLPAGRILKILEIGAGTGGLTSQLLPLLPLGRTHYRFTDIGAAFVAQAKEKYKDLGWMEYSVLDIEKDPLAQGFEANHFDIVLAANCLHATRDMRSTLDHVRMLLAPGGLMLLLEGTRGRRWIDLIFGLTEGWWLFKDFERRPTHPLLDAEAWKKLAAESGFMDAAVFSKSRTALFDQSIIAARVPGTETETADRPEQQLDKDAWLLFADQRGVGEALSRTLRDRGDDCQLIYKGSDFRRDAAGDYHIDPTNPDHFVQALQQFENSGGSGRRAVLFMWPLNEPDAEPQSADQLRDSQKDLCGGLLFLVQAMAGRENERRTRLWVISRRAIPTAEEGQAISLSSAPLAGLVKVIDLEHPELRCRAVDLDTEAGSDIELLLDELAVEDGELLRAYRDGQRKVPRVIHLGDRRSVDSEWLSLPVDQPARLINENRGTLDGLKIRPVPFTLPGPGQVTIQVRAAALNFRDVVCALGMIPDDDNPGLECAGRIVAIGKGVDDLAVGDDVIAVAPGAFATYVVANAALVAPKPAGMTFEQTATIPIAFLTAYHGLIRLADLKGGQRVLIHAASGGVGLAAVQLAKARGAEIFGTAGTPRKRAFLSSIGVDHVFDSRSIDFAERIMEVTQGAGVDVVLNSLSGDFITRSFAVLGKGGRFIEIGKRTIWTKEQAKASRPDAFYAFFDLAAMITNQPEDLRSVLNLLLEKFRCGELAPLPATILPMEQIIRAYRTMQQARHIGKMVVNQQPWSGGKLIDAADAFDGQGTFLITGAYGGIGLRLAEWLFERGARHFALIGRTEPREAAMARIAKLESAGAQIRPLNCDVASLVQVESVFSTIQLEMPPLRGVFHLAGALDDGALIQQNWSRFEKVIAPKVLGAWNLHCLTRRLELDCFVLFSSWSSFLGSQGQANHSAANAFLDALAWKRRAAGLPALSINWGAWAEIGAATKGDAAEHLRRRGIGSFSPDMGFSALGRLMSQGAVQVAVTPFNLKNWRNASTAAEKSTWFEYLDQDAAKESEGAGEDGGVGPLLSLKTALAAAQPGMAQHLLIEAFLKEQISKTLKLPLARIDSNKPFKSFGMDSLTALEFRNRIEAGTELTLSATLVWNYPTINKLAPFLFEKIALSTDQAADDLARENVDTEPSSSVVESQEKLEEIFNELDSLSEDEARRLLDEE